VNLRFSDRIKSLRKQNNLTQEMLGEKMGLAQKSIASWETEKSFPDTPTLARLCTYFNISADYLLGLSDDPTLRNDAADRAAAAELIASDEVKEITEEQLKEWLPEDLRDAVMALIKIRNRESEEEIKPKFGLF